MSFGSEGNEFNARATFFWRMDRVYRVYAGEEELFFIRIAGQSVDWAAALNQFGLLGVWLGRKLDARRGAALEARSADADRLSPQVLVHQHPHSFRLGIFQVASASFESGAAISLQGPHAAVWRLRFEDGRSWRFQLEEAHEAATALRVLSRALGSALLVKAVWDEGKQRFVAPRSEQRPAQTTTG